MRLIVTNAFGEYLKGDAITDAEQIKAVLESDNAANVVKTADLPDPEGEGQQATPKGKSARA